MSLNQELNCLDDEINHLINYHPFFKNTDYSQDKLIFLHNKVDSFIQKGPTVSSFFE